MVEAPPTERAVPTRATRLEWFVAVGVFLQLVAVVPKATDSVWAPQVFVGLILGLAGIPVLLALAWPGRRALRARSTWAARVALAFVLVALASALTSHPVALALVGLWDWGGSWVFILVFVGAWALGTTVSEGGRRLLGTAVIAGGTANAAVAVMQATVSLDALGLGLYNGTRAAGLMGNPVYLGGVLAASLCIAIERFRDDPRTWWLPVALCAAGIGVSAERLPALEAAVIVVAVILSAARGSPAERGDRLRRAGGYAALVVGGGLAGTALSELRHHSGVASQAAGTTAQGLIGDRLDFWRFSLDAAVHKPWLGYGPGQARAATLAHYSLSFSKTHLTEYFTDPHDLFVNYTLATGFIGAALLMAWLVLAFAPRRGAFMWAAAVLLLTEMLEPQYMTVMVVALLCLGAARPRSAAEVLGPPRSGAAPPGRRLVTAVVIGAVIGGLVGADVLAGNIIETRATALWLVGDPRAEGEALLADHLLRPWPEPAILLGNIAAVGLPVAGRQGFSAKQLLHPARANLTQAISWYRIAADRDPTNPSLWAQVASTEASAGKLHAAYIDAQRAYAQWPWNPTTLRLLAKISAGLGDRSAERHWLRLVLEVQPSAEWAKVALEYGCTTSVVSSLLGSC